MTLQDLKDHWKNVVDAIVIEVYTFATSISDMKNNLSLNKEL
jgi:hypothetical protein